MKSEKEDWNPFTTIHFFFFLMMMMSFFLIVMVFFSILMMIHSMFPFSIHTIRLIKLRIHWWIWTVLRIHLRNVKFLIIITESYVCTWVSFNYLNLRVNWLYNHSFVVYEHSLIVNEYSLIVIEYSLVDSLIVIEHWLVVLHWYLSHVKDWIIHIYSIIAILVQ